MSTDTPTTQSADIATEYNPFIPPQIDNPYPVYARARKEAPVFYSPELNLWIVTRYEDVSHILKDPARFSSLHNFDPASPLPPAVLEVLKGGYPNIFTMVVTDPPDHARLRGLLSQAFNAEKVAAMELRIREIANMLVDSFVHDDGRADLIVQYTQPLPIAVMSEIMGLPSADRDTIKRWLDDIPRLLWGQSMSLEEKLACAHNVVALQHYLAAQIEERRAVPQHDMLTDLLNARLEGQTPLATSEIVNLVTTVLFGSNENISKGIGNALMLLLGHPAQLQALRENLSLVDNVIAEAMRMEPSIQGLFRTTKQDVEIGGVAIPAGAHLQIMLGSANHDETHFPDPDRFDIHRKNLAQNHLAFGAGIHYCIGTPLTRLLGRSTIQVLLQRLPNLRLQPDQALEFEPSLGFRVLKHLLVEWDAAVAVGS